MMNKTINLFIMLTLISLVISGCTLGSSRQETPITDVDVYTGTAGLEIEFLKDSPPLEIYEKEPFQVVTLLKNKGAYPIRNGKIVLTYEEDYVLGYSPTSTFRLDGKDLYNQVDDQEIKSFFLTAKTINSLSQTHRSIVLVTACYDYMTRLNTEVCIDTDPHNIKLIEKACEPELKSFSGQGSPVSVARIETKMLSSERGVRPQFKIIIQNRGGGEVVSKNSINAVCSSTKIEKDDINGIVLNNIRFSDYNFADMDCVPDTLRLIEGEDYFICTLNENSIVPFDKPSFMTNLFLEFEYGYTETKSSEFDIKRANT